MSAQSAELTAGVAIVTAAVDANAIMATTTRWRTNVLIVGLPSCLTFIEARRGEGVKSPVHADDAPATTAVLR
ncbi:MULTISPECIES: hypothetical protein [unclassified Mycobacterium]|uniref:hypothetical protein n=1 Tax=unclassified Mycobacterium TaxID=2642494 RepID=UPI0018D443DC|nr:MULTISPECIES: hypothetical protein [unclassified Mycobacterium]